MIRPGAIRWCRALAVSAALLATNRASAEPAPPVDASTAIELGHQAIELFRERRFQEAFEQFERAEALMHSPVFVLYMAKSQVELGQWLSARELFAKVAGEAPAPEAPEVWRETVRNAGSELASLSAQIPSVDLVIRGDGKGPFVLYDGVVEHRVGKGRRLLELDPGRHALVVMDAKSQQVRRTVQLEPGQKGVPVVFDFGPAEQVGRAPTALAARAPRRVAASGSALKWGGFTALGLGGVALGFGGVAATIALQRKEEIVKNCVDNHCLESDQQRGAEARRWANLATAGFVVGAVGVGTGVTLLMLRPRADDGVTIRTDGRAVSIGGRW